MGMRLGEVLLPDFGPIGSAILLVELGVLLCILLKRPWMRYKFLHNKGIAFLLAFASLLLLGDLELPSYGFLLPAYALLGFAMTFIVLPLWILGIATTLTYFIFSFLVKEELSEKAENKGK